MSHELDFEVGEKIMGWHRVHGMMHGREQDVLMNANGSTVSVTCGCAEDFNPSTDISAAYNLIEVLRVRGIWTHIRNYLHTSQVSVEMGVPSSETQEWGATAAEAICKCALKAVEKWPLNK